MFHSHLSRLSNSIVAWLIAGGDSGQNFCENDVIFMKMLNLITRNYCLCDTMRNEFLQIQVGQLGQGNRFGVKVSH